MNEPVSGGPFRRFGIDYAGPMLDDDLAEALIDMVNASGRHVDGADDGPVDEIERLRAEVAEWRRAADHNAHIVADQRDQIVKLGAEIERLRAALREIRALHQPEWASDAAKDTVATIREALGDE